MATATNEKKPKEPLSAILKKAGKRALGGGVPGFAAMIIRAYLPLCFCSEIASRFRSAEHVGVTDKGNEKPKEPLSAILKKVVKRKIGDGMAPCFLIRFSYDTAARRALSRAAAAAAAAAIKLLTQQHHNALASRDLISH